MLSIKNEIWKDIKEYEGLYQVSNYGNVRSFYKYNARKNGAKVIDIPRLLKPVNVGNDYLRVRLAKNTIKTNFAVHRLVAEHFIKNSLNKPLVNHIDGNPLNNNLENLEWCTESENIMHAVKNNLIKHRKISMYDLNDNLIITFSYRKEIEKYLKRKIYQEQITRCCNRKIKTSYGYKWKWTYEMKC